MSAPLIVIDGNDGSGKATQAALLKERLEKEGKPVLKVDFPAYTENVFGALIGECLAGKHGDFPNLDPKIASALYAVDRMESAPKIREALQQGTVVIADRYASSNQIHQGGKIQDPIERAAFLEWLDRVEYGVCGIPRPDAVIYLRVPLEVSLALLAEKRAVKNGNLGEGERDTVEEDIAYLTQSVEAAGWLSTRESHWHVVDCMKDGTLRSVEDIHQEVFRIVTGIASV